MTFVLGYLLGLSTAGLWLIGQAFSEASKMKRRREDAEVEHLAKHTMGGPG